MSPFEEKVYQAVCRIPKGETQSYKWVAEKIGHPHAYRAVGNALNKNPYPGIIPCHRVIRSDGEIGGFSQGTRTKISLLLKEGSRAVPG
jgi:methylated-DNA-[protein]-cysteine S-methyltransferase